jgi:hypothetical protein
MEGKGYSQQQMIRLFERGKYIPEGGLGDQDKRQDGGAKNKFEREDKDIFFFRHSIYPRSTIVFF